MLALIRKFFQSIRGMSGSLKLLGGCLVGVIAIFVGVAGFLIQLDTHKEEVIEKSENYFLDISADITKMKSAVDFSEKNRLRAVILAKLNKRTCTDQWVYYKVYKSSFKKDMGLACFYEQTAREEFKKASAPAKAPPTPKSGVNRSSGPILRVFFKSNIRPSDIERLHVLLPNYVIQSGNSSLSQSGLADILFVNTDKVTVKETIAVVEAMSRIGVPIRGIEKGHAGGRREIQLGTMHIWPTNDADKFFAPYQACAVLDSKNLRSIDERTFWAYTSRRIDEISPGKYECYSTLDGQSRIQGF